MHFDLEHIRKIDPEVAKALDLEFERQQTHLELIASENFTSRAVMEAAGSVLTNKYAEGYPGKRYYGGCQFVDIAEDLARDRAKKLFNCDCVNVQPHSGSQANMAVYLACLNYGDTVMGLNLSHGGHLTHGSPVNISGLYFKFVAYGVQQGSEVIDYSELLKQAKEVKPKMIVTGATAYPRTLDFKKFKDISDEVGAILMVDIAHIAGLCATGYHVSPVPYAQVVTTTTHKTLRGPRGGMVMSNAEYGPKIDKAVFPGMQGGPLMHIIAAKAVAFGEALKPEFKTYQGQIIKNAQALAKALIDEKFRLVSGGTDTHLMLVDLRGHKITGKEAEKVLDEVGLTVNKNTIPFDPEKPFVTSGIRVGVPAVTTRGMKESEMKEIARFISEAIEARANDTKKKEIREKVKQLCLKFPLYTA